MPVNAPPMKLEILLVHRLVVRRPVPGRRPGRDPGQPAADEIEKERAAAGARFRQAVSGSIGVLGGAFTGDLGNSFVYGRPALEVILERMPATLELAFLAMLIAVVLGVPLGLYAGLRPESRIARTIMAGSIIGFSLPTFWVGLVLIMVFAVELGWLPSTDEVRPVEVFGMDCRSSIGRDCASRSCRRSTSRCSSCR